jgi:aldose 1-epimerase
MTKSSDIFILKNRNRVEVSFIARGGQITSIKVPNANGEIADVVIGYDTIDDALAGDAYFGAICGRFANRIVNGQFQIDGTTYQLECNDNKNHIHGGSDGFNNRVWKVEPIEDHRYEQAYKLSIVSVDGDQNYPGELTVSVTYGLTEDNEFVIDYLAESTKDTVINLTSHAYFNLKGAGTGTIEKHELQLNASKYTPIDKEIGTVSGEIADVKDTAMDFIESKAIGEAVNSDDSQIKLFGGIDHNFVIDGYSGDLRLAARLFDPESKRGMEVYTDQPGVQVYTGCHFNSSEKGKLGAPIEKWAGVALETQVFPNSPNHDHFPNAILRAGEKYKHVCIYKFTF